MSTDRFFQLMRVALSCQASLLLTLLTGSVVRAETIQLKLKNGDTINGELIQEESTEALKVLMHPQLGRLEVSQDAIQPAKKTPKWTSTISAGVNAGNQDGDGTSQPISTAPATTKTNQIN